MSYVTTFFEDLDIEKSRQEGMYINAIAIAKKLIAQGQSK